MKKTVKRLKDYDKVEFDQKEVVEGMSSVKPIRKGHKKCVADAAGKIVDAHDATFRKLAK